MLFEESSYNEDAFARHHNLNPRYRPRQDALVFCSTSPPIWSRNVFATRVSDDQEWLSVCPCNAEETSPVATITSDVTVEMSDKAELQNQKLQRQAHEEHLEHLLKIKEFNLQSQRLQHQIETEDTMHA